MKQLVVLVALTSTLTLVDSSLAAVPDVSGTIKVDGSSTVYPITEAVAEEFGKEHSATKVTVGISGTGGGFKKFCAGETDISDASRPIKAAEVELCSKAGITYIELPIAYDALSVVVHPANTWATSMTVAELKKLWEPEAQGKITRWSQLRAGWPDTPIALFGAGTDSGTFDYFTEAIVGKEKASRGDFTASEDDNVLVQGVASNKNALGYFGLAYLEENAGKIKAVAIDDENAKNGEGSQLPSKKTVAAGTYRPLARPLFVYVRTEALARPEVQAFVTFYLKNGKELSNEVGYIPLTDKEYALATYRFEKRVQGSLFASGHNAGTALEQLLARGNG